jgi:hypothetical protein
LGNAETEGGAGVIGRSLTVHAKEPFGNIRLERFLSAESSKKIAKIATFAFDPR